MYVDLDPFRLMIAKYKYGRLVLNNGESTTFALKFLLPPSKDEKRREAIGRMKRAVLMETDDPLGKIERELGRV